ncbi:MAG: hypothetical protein ACR2KP_05320 [Egibacteraceae bacterium]
MRHLIVVAAAAFVLGMASRGLIARDTATPSGVRADVPGAVTAGTSSTGRRGPTETEAGIPSGFDHSPTGASTAAAAFVQTGQAILAMTPNEVEAAVRTMAAAGAADTQLADTVTRVTAAHEALAGSSAPIEFHQAILATRIDAYTPQRSRVSVWSVGVLSREGVAPPQAGWAVSTFDLVWERGDWKVWAESIEPGPAPVTNNAVVPATSAQLRERLAGFTDYRTIQ